jgi:cellulose synthase/poly-beta-1,6-N-acetylglucosamine synthase-like glycosyltransferase
MVDGCPTVEDENSVETFLNLKRIWNIDTSKAEHAHGCRIYKGVFDQVPYRVYVKGPECPTGKRQSHIVFFQTLEELIKQKELEKPFGIHMVDGDTGSFDGLSDMAKMFGVMVANPGTAAICSNVLPINHNYCNLLLCEQAFEYSYFFRWNTGGLSLFGSVQTAVGMSVLYDYELLLTAIVPDGLGMTLIEKYCAESTTFFDLAMLDLAEDYGLTLFMQQAGFDSMMCHLSHFRTSVPATWQDFFGQRRRWNTAYLIGTWHLLFVNSPYFMVYKNARWLIWIFDVVQLLCTFFGASSIVSLWVEYLADGIAEINPYYRLHIKDAEYIAFGSVWGVLLLYFIAILDRNNAESLYLLIAASVFGILFSIYYYIMSIIEGTYDIFLFMMASIVPHFFINDYRYDGNILTHKFTQSSEAVSYTKLYNFLCFRLLMYTSIEHIFLQPYAYTQHYFQCHYALCSFNSMESPLNLFTKLSITAGIGPALLQEPLFTLSSTWA